jgi:hypothetical protein
MVNELDIKCALVGVVDPALDAPMILLQAFIEAQPESVAELPTSRPPRLQCLRGGHSERESSNRKTS